MKTDFCIIGSGIAGMSLSIRLSAIGNVSLISKSQLISGSTPLAQGGIASVFQVKDTPLFSQKKDSIESHFDDTMKAGRFKNNTEAVRILVESAPQVMQDLLDWGIQFHPDKHLEGGHSFPRIFHTGDETGKTIAEGLAKKIKKLAQSGRIEILENMTLTSIKKNEAHFFNTHTHKSKIIHSQQIFLATGGYSSLFEYFTTPKENKGDAISIFLQAGGKVKNLNWIQFHPTVLDLPREPRLLLSEAIRGAGATIIQKTADEIYSPLCNPLLPRDIVSQHIFEAQKKGISVFLDCRNIDHFDTKFPSISGVLKKEFQLDATHDLLPIRPAAHYCMGGIETDLVGRTNLPGIFALGECANTGVHGKNRLASNSLLEGLVFAKQIAEYIQNTNHNDDYSDSDSDHNNDYEYEYRTQSRFRSYIPTSKEDQKNITHIRHICSRYLGLHPYQEQIREGKKALKKLILSPHSGNEVLNMKRLAEEIFTV